MKRVKRRDFLQAALAGMAALTLVPVPVKAVPFSEVFQPAGDWAEVHPDGQTVATLDGIFKRVYGNRIRTHMIPACIKRIEDNQRKLSEPMFFQPVALKFQNGFTEAR